MSDERLNGDGGADDDDATEGTTPEQLRWRDYQHPSVLDHPDEFTTMNPKAGHTLVAPRCTAKTAAGPRCKAAASVLSEGRVFCGQHDPEKAKEKERVRPRRGGSLKDRLRSRADEDYDALEDELLTLAQSAMTSKTVTCRGCKRKTVVEVADASVRLRAIEAIFDRTGAAKATAANKGDDDLVGKSITLESIRGMETTDLVRYYDFIIARDADLLEEVTRRQEDYRSLKAEYGGSKVVERGLASATEEAALRRIYERLREMFEPRSIAA